MVNDARRHDIRMLRPHVNHSDDACTLEKLGENRGKSKERKSETQGDGLRLGLRYLRGLGDAGSERIIQARGAEAFVDLADFCRWTRLPRPFVSDLVRAGALDGLGDSGEVAAENERRQMLWSLGALQYEEELWVEVPDAPTALPPLEAGEAFTWDYELLGMSPEDHPMRLLRSRLSRRGVTTADALETQQPGKLVKVAGMVVVRQAPPTAKGHLFITLEDETGLSNLIIRPDLYAECRARLLGAMPCWQRACCKKTGRQRASS